MFLATFCVRYLQSTASSINMSRDYVAVVIARGISHPHSFYFNDISLLCVQLAQLGIQSVPSSTHELHII